MSKQSIGKNILINVIIGLFWLLLASICIFIIEKYRHLILEALGLQIKIDSPKEILMFYSNIGATIAGILLAVVAMILNLNGKVGFTIFKEAGNLKRFIRLCVINLVIFILCSLSGLIGLYGIISLRIPTYLFIAGLCGLILIGFISINLLTDSKDINSSTDGHLERISSQLDSIFQTLSKK